MRSSNNLLDQAIDRVFSVMGALYMSQFPRFMNLYMDLLSNIIAGKQVIQTAAKTADGSFISSILSFLKGFGIELSLKRDFASNVDKLKFYQTSIARWKEVSELEKPFIFLSNIDFDVVRTLDYTIVLQKDTRSLIYAFVGIFVGALVYKLFIKVPYYLFFVKERKSMNRGKSKTAK